MSKVKEVKDESSTIQGNIDFDREVNNTVQAGWNRWGNDKILFDNSMTVVKPATMYGLETSPLAKKQSARSSRHENAKGFPESDEEGRV